MDLPRRDFTKTAVLGSIAVGTGGLSPVNNFFEPLVGLTAAAQRVLILAYELTPTAHDPSPVWSRDRGHIIRSSANPHCHT
jgi:hypothetical protein